MMSDILQKHFGIQAEQSYLVRNQMRYISGGVLYTVVPVTNVDEDTLVELYEMSEHLSREGDKYVSRFVPSTDQKFLVTENEMDYVVLGNAPHPTGASNKLGRKLARFHERGRSIEKVIKSCSRIGEWKSLWEKRLDQMEGVWNNYLMERPDREFSRLFIESYPYYMGLAENAIQYLVDTEMDEETRDADAGTVCHVRFQEGIWGSEIYIKDPFDWVFDHASRDIAEWIRERYFSHNRTFQPDIRTFLQDYESVSPLTAFSWRLAYSRLLFPIHYFECIEDYFTASSEQTQNQLEDKLERMMKTSREYEAFLGNFYRIADVPIKKMSLPEIQWLKK